ncbi:hypothetical protein GF312_08170 [Candidatus Poribacteria bacterium]|nr:hypothetical protein [Candidatus Poribacteria bacterium]
MSINIINTKSGLRDIVEKVTEPGGTLDKDAFLNLLVTQMRYQNPMKPMSNEEFIAQTAQFSSLEQMQNLNVHIQDLLEMQRTSSKASALNLIGKEVKIENSSFSLKSGSPVNLSYSVSSTADVNISIYNSSGQVVRTFDMGENTPGIYSFIWDGLNEEGVMSPDGDYTYVISAVDSAGNEVGPTEIIIGVVDGLITSDDGIQISVDGQRFSLENVIEVREITPADPDD